MDLKTKIKEAPLEPGCYLFKDEQQNIIYVGKAKVLRSRVRQYFMKNNQKDEKGLILAKKINDVEFVLTPTERDALIEEYKLIKKYRPWFNMQHKSDRDVTCYIKLNRSNAYSFFEIVNEKLEESQDYFGYFKSERKAKEAIFTLNRVFKTPICNHQFDRAVGRTCLHYSTNQCLGPCKNKVPPAEYEQVMDEIVAFFKGKQAHVYKRLNQEMNQAVEALAFEKAAEIKRNTDELMRLGEQYRHYVSVPEDRDVIVFLRAYRETGFSLFYIHDQKVSNRCDFNRQLEEGLLEQFLAENEQSDRLITADKNMTDCLRHISADKLFVILPPAREKKKIKSLIIKKYKEFIRD